MTNKTRKRAGAPMRTTRAGKDNWPEMFLLSLGRMPNVSVACESAHISRDAAYKKRAADPDFAARWDNALKRGIELLEAECWRRATIGVKRGVWMKDANGRPVKVEDVSDFSDVLAIFLLKAHAPEKYRETFRQELTGPDGGTIKVESELADRRTTAIVLQEIRTALERKLKANGNGNGHGDVKQIEAQVVVKPEENGQA